MYWYHRISPFLTLFFAAVGIILHFKVGIATALPLYLGALFLLVTYLLFGNIWLALGKLKRGNLHQAETILKSIKYPKLLFRTHRAYYHFIQGMLAIKQENMEDGKVNLEEALEIGIHRATDRALITLNLASLYLQQNNIPKASNYIKETLECPTNDLLIKQRAVLFERKIQDLLSQQKASSN
ncbi:MAG: hypothetical protein HC892_05255 [Saprospiraceae bacterium]|nr:hypothetical protein [Saprospiraceae bacterium]